MDSKNEKNRNKEVNEVIKTERDGCSKRFIFLENINTSKAKNNERIIIALMINEKFAFILIFLNSGIIKNIDKADIMYKRVTTTFLRKSFGLSFFIGVPKIPKISKISEIIVLKCVFYWIKIYYN